MYFKQYLLILLLTFICASGADIDSSVDVAVESDIPNLSEDVLHLAKTCVSDSDCLNSGSCEARTGGKVCKCKNGTSGDFCDKVNECVDNPVKCGELDDVSCVFDIEKEKAVCKCDNETKTFIEDEGRCMSPCLNGYICGEHGYCEHKVGNQKFCMCELGTSGDYCEIIDQCHNKVVDCGTDNNATCTLGGKGKAYCKCDDLTKGFDYDNKICKSCEECGENSYGAGGCIFKDGHRRCSCNLRYYSSPNGTCEDCKCGQDAYGCKFENGTKFCQCWTGAAHKDGLCQKCDCGGGLGVSKCEFKDDKKICTCKEGYAFEGSNGSCKPGKGLLPNVAPLTSLHARSKLVFPRRKTETGLQINNSDVAVTLRLGSEMCNATNSCSNGGKCVQNACKCLKGTSGDFCATIDDCGGRLKCGFANCLYNESSQQAYCKCDGSLAFDDYSKTCKVCDCGSIARSCGYVNGKKRCICSEAYADKLGKCEVCFCKGYSSMYNCKFDDNGYIKCPCLKGYAQNGYEAECKKCDCGDHGKCTITGWSKSCTCDDGYAELDGKCEKCDCSKYGVCYFYDGKKMCSCNQGYQDYKGTCKDCKCPWNAICGFNEHGVAECTCKDGYGMKHGVCTPCDCYPGDNCIFKIASYINENKICICPKGYANAQGKCLKCDCQAVGSNCTYESGYNRCECPEGFQEEKKTSTTRVCVKIDICRNSNPCPPLSTNCVNTAVGQYECQCKEGYEPHYPFGGSIERDGCQDINECERNYKPCDDVDARCVNTPGSYRCDCKYGYIYKATEEQRNVCHVGSSGTRPWKTASITVGVTAAVVIIGLLIAVFHKHHSC